jgi:hypothetical protein
MRIVAIFCQISLFFRSRLINMIEAIKPIDEALLVNEDTQPAKYGKELRLFLEEMSQNYDHLVAQSAMVKGWCFYYHGSGRSANRLISGRPFACLIGPRTISVMSGN